ncbi:MAG TPA: sigma-54 dependent transcriptional regulator [Thermoanaerobaculia bacterium]|nr:sigma-54 dependent transcriptional regulator [Thermoanaerobaculia bacterium]
MNGFKVLLVEDDPGLRFVLRDFLESQGLTVEEAATVSEARRLFRQFRPDAALLDYLLPDGNALELLYSLKAIAPGVPLVLLTGHGSIDLAVRAMKAGAEEFLVKPVELPALEAVLRRVLHRRRAELEAADLPPEDTEPVDLLLGRSRAIEELTRELGAALRSRGPILLQGETGTGKGMLANWLHRHGGRRRQSMVDLNCAGLSPEFLESELFGHARGAFTGAVTEKRGLLELADQGTLFLDEIGEMSQTVQAKLLKAIEEKRFRRMGENLNRQVDLFLISATHHDLALEAREKRFRSDLYFRISTFPLRLPSLRERREDLPALAHQMLRDLSHVRGVPEATFTPEALGEIASYPWPGNFRELKNVLELALLRSRGAPVTARDLRLETAAAEPPTAAREPATLEELKLRQIEAVLREEKGHVARAAKRLGMARSALYLKIRECQIDLKRFQE